MAKIFVQADSSQAEARVVFLIANDEDALRDIDVHDYHALTATWFFGGVEDDYSKKALGYEHPIRFAGKTLRHACHLKAAKKRATIELNTQARKYKIPITITEAESDRAIKIFHAKQPKIQHVFHNGVIEALRVSRTLVAGMPWGFDCNTGGRRTFFERFGDELFRMALSYIPQRSVSDNTKAAGIRILRTIEDIQIIMESHDALLFCFDDKYLDSYCPIIKLEMERPISFENCSLPRRMLKIPCDIEVGYNYQELKKYKQIKAAEAVLECPTLPEKMSFIIE
jgi:hypothetical protein